MNQKENFIYILAILGCLSFHSTNSVAQLPYSETFAGQNSKGAVGPTPTIDISGVTWSIDISSASLTAPSDWFQVQSEVMEAQDVDGEVIWESPSIDVSSLTSTVNLSVDFSEEGTLESGDYARAFYVLDGGAETQFSTNGDNSDDFTAVTAEQTLILSGNTSLKIVIKIKNNAGGEFIRFDNVSVAELSPCVEPTDQATSLILTPNATSLIGSFTEASSSPDNYIVVISTSSTLSSNPIDATSYNIGDAIGGGTVVTKTSLTSFSATDLSQGTQYYLFIFAYNSLCTGGPNYHITSPLTGNTTTETVPNIIITEIMQNPDGVSDDDGEYFEIYNNSGATVDINGWTIKDAGANTHTISNGSALNITNGGYLILAKNANSASNGGVTVDYQYSSGFTLTNTDDEIILLNSSGIEVDRVEYDGGVEFPDPTGASMYLKAFNLDNNVGSNWATATTSEGISPDKGSPGVIGEASLLPVELVKFQAHQYNELVILNWETATEKNNSHFEVERSIDGFEFQEIDRVSGNGTTALLSYYSTSDLNPENGTNYYRLKQVDFDGKFEYSQTVTVHFNSSRSQFNIYPSLTRDNLTVEFPTDWTANTTIQIFNFAGQLVIKRTFNDFRSNLNVESLPSGNYIIRAINGSQMKALRFTKL